MTDDCIRRAGLARSPAVRPASAANSPAPRWRAAFASSATARDPQQIADLVTGKEGQAIALRSTSPTRRQIAAAVKEAERAFGRIDVLVNNAGYGYMAAVEEGEDAGDPRPVRDQFLRPGGDDPRRPAGHAGAPPRRDRQHLLGRRPARLGRRRLLRRDQIRGERPLGSARAGSRAARHPRDARRAGPVPHRLGRPLAASNRPTSSPITRRRPQAAAARSPATAASSRAIRRAPPRR